MRLSRRELPSLLTQNVFTQTTQQHILCLCQESLKAGTVNSVAGKNGPVQIEVTQDFQDYQVPEEREDSGESAEKGIAIMKSGHF